MPPVAHPGNDYFVNIVSHTIQRISNPLLQQAALAAGYIGPYDYQTARGVAAGLAHESGTTPSGTNPLTTGQQAAKGATSALGGVAAIGDFFNRLTEKNTWLRVGEVVAGLLLLYIGLKAVTTGTPVGEAAKSVTKPVKAVASATPTGRAFKVEKEVRRTVAAKKHSAAVAKGVARRTANP